MQTEKRILHHNSHETSKYLVRPHKFSCPPTPKKIMQTTKGVAWTCTTMTREVAWTLNKLARNVYLFLSLPAAQRNHKLQQSDFKPVQKFQIVPKDLLLKSLGIGIHVFKTKDGTPHHWRIRHLQLLGRLAHLRNEVSRSERKSVFIPLQIQSFQAWVFLSFLPLLGRMAHLRNEVLRSVQTTKMGFISIIW